MASSAEVSAENTRSLILSLFPSRIDSFVRFGQAGQWRPVSRFHHLTDEEILECIEGSTKVLRASTADTKTRFLAMEIGAESPYRTPEKLFELRSLFDSVHIKLKHYQYGESWFLYLFLDDWIETKSATELLGNWLESHGYRQAQGILEIHPSNSPLPIPMQADFCWLNEKCQLVVRRQEISADSAMALFAADAFRTVSRVEDFLSAMKNETAQGGQVLELPKVEHETMQFGCEDAPVETPEPPEELSRHAAKIPTGVFFAEAILALDDANQGSDFLAEQPADSGEPLPDEQSVPVLQDCLDSHEELTTPSRQMDDDPVPVNELSFAPEAPDERSVTPIPIQTEHESHVQLALPFPGWHQFDDAYLDESLHDRAWRGPPE